MCTSRRTCCRRYLRNGDCPIAAWRGTSLLLSCKISSGVLSRREKTKSGREEERPRRRARTSTTMFALVYLRFYVVLTATNRDAQRPFVLSRPQRVWRDFGATISSAGRPADVGDREFWAWARDMRRGLASARWNIALICARTRLCVSARGGTRESEREKRERGETNRPFDVIISPREKPCRSPTRPLGLRRSPQTASVR